MKIEVNITKTRFFVIVATILVIGGALIAVAYDSDVGPAVFGHSAMEIKNLPLIATGSGILRDGDVIPLPKYFDGTNATQDECQWTVSLATFTDIEQTMTVAADSMNVTTSSNRTVIAVVHTFNNANGVGITPSQREYVNYMIVCVHRVPG